MSLLRVCVCVCVWGRIRVSIFIKKLWINADKYPILKSFYKFIFLLALFIYICEFFLFICFPISRNLLISGNQSVSTEFHWFNIAQYFYCVYTISFQFHFLIFFMLLKIIQIEIGVNLTDLIYYHCKSNCMTFASSSHNGQKNEFHAVLL